MSVKQVSKGGDGRETSSTGTAGGIDDKFLLRVREVGHGSQKILEYELQPGFDTFTKRLKRDPLKHFEEILSDEKIMTDIKRVEELGAAHCDELMPLELRKKLRSLQGCGDHHPLQIVSNEAWIPWELLYLRDPDGQFKEGAFLAEAFQLVQGLEKWEPATELPLSPLRIVAPMEEPLPNAAEEEEIIKSLAESSRCEVKSGATFLEPLLAEMESSAARCWHFIGHGLGASENPYRRSFLLDGAQQLRPQNLERTNRFGGVRPLVFLNACHSAQGAMALSDPGGFVEALRKAGAGAIVAARWAVDDEPALCFAQEFYSRFLSGEKTIGEAVHEARLCVKENFLLSSTWLAYAVYADPLASCGRTEPPLDFPSRSLNPLTSEDDELTTHQPLAARPQIWVPATVLILFLVIAFASVPSPLKNWLSRQLQDGQTADHIEEKADSGRLPEDSTGRDQFDTPSDEPERLPQGENFLKENKHLGSEKEKDRRLPDTSGTRHLEFPPRNGRISVTFLNGTPVECTPVESTPVESTPVESTPVESTPIGSTPACWATERCSVGPFPTAPKLEYFKPLISYTIRNPSGAELSRYNIAVYAGRANGNGALNFNTKAKLPNIDTDYKGEVQVNLSGFPINKSGIDYLIVIALLDNEDSSLWRPLQRYSASKLSTKCSESFESCCLAEFVYKRRNL